MYDCSVSSYITRPERRINQHTRVVVALSYGVYKACVLMASCVLFSDICRPTVVLVSR